MANEHDPLKVLLIGNGGREHAIVWKLLQSSRVDHIFVVPGNGGTAALPKVTNITDVKPEDFAGLVALAKAKSINLLVPGPEAPLVAGIVDFFKKSAPSIRCFGPSERAARMEGSKTFSKDFMRRFSIPTAEYHNFDDYETARAYVDSLEHRVVIKASGLAAGKGVIIPVNKDEAFAALKDIMLNKEFGSAGDEVVIEELLEGDELSILSFCDGPNTGGMGTYAPTRTVSQDVLEKIHKDILQPTLDGMREEGFPFIGVLFTGLMMTKSGPKVLEYNVRFGDPETQSCLPLLLTDLADVMVACADGDLGNVKLEISDKAVVTVVAAAGGYPGSYAKGYDIELDFVLSDTIIFHAGTAFVDGKLKTSGGRVIAATGVAETLEEAAKRAYKGIESIHFEKMQYRKDIAARALR